MAAVEEVAQTFADAGITIHLAATCCTSHCFWAYVLKGLLRGNTIVNIQTPSLAAYIPACKAATLKDGLYRN